jgi:hypothetical protein
MREVRGWLALLRCALADWGAASIDKGIGSDAGGETNVDLTPYIGVDSTFIAGSGRRTGARRT